MFPETSSMTEKVTTYLDNYSVGPESLSPSWFDGPFLPLCLHFCSRLIKEVILHRKGSLGEDIMLLMAKMYVNGREVLSHKLNPQISKIWGVHLWKPKVRLWESFLHQWFCEWHCPHRQLCSSCIDLWRSADGRCRWVIRIRMIPETHDQKAKL